mmetsp:Transcript_53764/g.149172  ORF Transcript_53764/g.149172 Transcript_53764/m.149172 type:complete len:240 (-) Transcript_53764:538-1257(-)
MTSCSSIVPMSLPSANQSILFQLSAAFCSCAMGPLGSTSIPDLGSFSWTRTAPKASNAATIISNCFTLMPHSPKATGASLIVDVRMAGRTCTMSDSEARSCRAKYCRMPITFDWNGRRFTCTHLWRSTLKFRGLTASECAVPVASVPKTKPLTAMASVDAVAMRVSEVMPSSNPLPKKPWSSPADRLTNSAGDGGPSGRQDSQDAEAFARRTLRQALPTPRPKSKNLPSPKASYAAAIS